MTIVPASESVELPPLEDEAMSEVEERTEEVVKTVLPWVSELDVWEAATLPYVRFPRLLARFSSSQQDLPTQAPSEAEQPLSKLEAQQTGPSSQNLSMPGRGSAPHSLSRAPQQSPALPIEKSTELPSRAAAPLQPPIAHRIQAQVHQHPLLARAAARHLHHATLREKGMTHPLSLPMALQISTPIQGPIPAMPWQVRQEQDDREQRQRPTSSRRSFSRISAMARECFPLLHPARRSLKIHCWMPCTSTWQPPTSSLPFTPSRVDILLLFIALLKLDLTVVEEEKKARRQERDAQLRYLEQEVKNLKTQSRWLLFSHVGAGVLGILSGATPIVGYMKGDQILSAASSIFTSLQGAKKKEFFEGLTKMLSSMSEMQRATGQIHTTWAEGDRTRFNRMSELHRTDHEECSRGIEQLHERFRQSEQFLLELLRMWHEVASTLYR